MLKGDRNLASLHARRLVRIAHTSLHHGETSPATAKGAAARAHGGDSSRLVARHGHLMPAAETPTGDGLGAQRRFGGAQLPESATCAGLHGVAAAGEGEALKHGCLARWRWLHILHAALHQRVMAARQPARHLDLAAGKLLPAGGDGHKAAARYTHPVPAHTLHLHDDQAPG